jgi:hypothetical protein
LKVAIKRMEETQLFEDEQKEANEHNSVLFDRSKELEVQFMEENQTNNGNVFLFFTDHSYPKVF